MSVKNSAMTICFNWKGIMGIIMEYMMVSDISPVSGYTKVGL